MQFPGATSQAQNVSEKTKAAIAGRRRESRKRKI
jgi:hypothetical protein